MPLHPNTSIYGYPGDNFGTIWRMRWYKDSRKLGITDFSYNPNLAAPFGTYFVEEGTPVLYFEPLKLMTFLTNEVFAYNFILFLSFVLTPFFMFLLLHYLTKNVFASFIGSLIFNLAPYHFWHSFNHLDLAEIQWIPLYVLALLNLEKKRNIWSAFLAAAAYLLVIYTSFYYGYFMFLFTIVFLAFKISFDILTQKKAWFNFQKIKKHLISYSIFGLIVFIFMLPTFKAIIYADVSPEMSSLASAKKTVDELTAMSARPWDYLVPSVNHPVFGKYSLQFYDWIRTQLSDFKGLSTFVQERTLYLGAINLILAFLGILIWLRRWLHHQSKTFFPLIFFLMAIVLALTSGPPYVGIRAHTIYLPSYYLFNLSSFLQGFRVYARLGVVVLLCTTIISSLGIKYIFEILAGKLEGFRRKTIILSTVYCLLSTLILFDFLNVPPFNVTDVSTIPQCYQWLAEQPNDFIFVENPDLYAYTDALLFQRIHQKKLFNMMGGRLHDAVWPLVNDLDNPEDIDHLKAFGVKYIFLHTKNIFPPDELDHIRYMRIAKALDPKIVPENLEVVQQCSEGLIYKIKDFQPKDKIYVIREKSEKWYPTGDWELKDRVNYLFIANATAETKTKRLRFESDTQALEIKIDNGGDVIEIIDNIIEIPPGLTRVVVINKGGEKDVILKNLKLREIDCGETC